MRNANHFPRHPSRSELVYKLKKHGHSDIIRVRPPPILCGLKTTKFPTKNMRVSIAPMLNEEKHEDRIKRDMKYALGLNRLSSENLHRVSMKQQSVYEKNIFDFTSYAVQQKMKSVVDSSLGRKIEQWRHRLDLDRHPSKRLVGTDVRVLEKMLSSGMVERLEVLKVYNRVVDKHIMQEEGKTAKAKTAIGRLRNSIMTHDKNVLGQKDLSQVAKRAIVRKVDQGTTTKFTLGTLKRMRKI